VIGESSCSGGEGVDPHPSMAAASPVDEEVAGRDEGVVDPVTVVMTVESSARWVGAFE
jgi:hypothetical protein